MTLSVFWKQSYLKNIWKLPSKISMAERFLRTLARSLWAFQVKTCRLYRVCSLKREFSRVQDPDSRFSGFHEIPKFQNHERTKVAVWRSAYCLKRTPLQSSSWTFSKIFKRPFRNLDWSDFSTCRLYAYNSG